MARKIDTGFLHGLFIDRTGNHRLYAAGQTQVHSLCHIGHHGFSGFRGRHPPCFFPCPATEKPAIDRAPPGRNKASDNLFIILNLIVSPTTDTAFSSQNSSPNITGAALIKNCGLLPCFYNNFRANAHRIPHGNADNGSIWSHFKHLSALSFEIIHKKLMRL